MAALLPSYAMTHFTLKPAHPTLTPRYSVEDSGSRRTVATQSLVVEGRTTASMWVEVAIPCLSGGTATGPISLQELTKTVSACHVRYVAGA